MIKVYGYKKWGTVIKSLKFLQENKIEYDFFDFVASQISQEVLEDLIKRSNEEIGAFFNKNGQLYRQQNLKERLPELSYEEKLNLLLSDGKMIKRPIIDFGNQIFLGFSEKNILEYLNNN